MLCPYPPSLNSGGEERERGGGYREAQCRQAMDNDAKTTTMTSMEFHTLPQLL